jgi:hypothetical protein
MENLADENRGEQERGKVRFLGTLLIVILCVAVTGVTLVAISGTFQWKPSDFVGLPTTPISKTGQTVVFSNVSPIMDGITAVGIQGTLQAQTGGAIAGAQVYVTYYFEGTYRTQVATTGQDGSFAIMFPMNWTGWLPLKVTYFGDPQHKGLTRIVSLQGEVLVEKQKQAFAASN